MTRIERLASKKTEAWAEISYNASGGYEVGHGPTGIYHVRAYAKDAEEFTLGTYRDSSKATRAAKRWVAVR